MHEEETQKLQKQQVPMSNITDVICDAKFNACAQQL
jgi:hypothetical protein